MKKIIFLFLSTFLLASCASKKFRPEGAPPEIKGKLLLSKIDSAQNQYQTLIIKANGKFTNSDGAQSFRAEFRVQKDSIIWIDIADPFLGIKVARAIVYPDSVAFVNKIERQFYTGGINQIQQRIGMELGFDLLENLLAANLVYPIQDKDYELFYRPGYYVLADFALDKTTDSAQGFPMGEVHQVFIDPESTKPQRQVQTKQNENLFYELVYENMIQREGLSYPQKISILSKGNTGVKLELQIKSVQKDLEVRFPFKIPTGYAPIP